MKITSSSAQLQIKKESQIEDYNPFLGSAKFIADNHYNPNNYTQDTSVNPFKDEKIDYTEKFVPKVTPILADLDSYIAPAMILPSIPVAEVSDEVVTIVKSMKDKISRTTVYIEHSEVVFDTKDESGRISVNSSSTSPISSIENVEYKGGEYEKYEGANLSNKDDYLKRENYKNITFKSNPDVNNDNTIEIPHNNTREISLTEDHGVASGEGQIIKDKIHAIKSKHHDEKKKAHRNSSIWSKFFGKKDRESKIVEIDEGSNNGNKNKKGFNFTYLLYLLAFLLIVGNIVYFLMVTQNKMLENYVNVSTNYLIVANKDVESKIISSSKTSIANMQKITSINPKICNFKNSDIAALPVTGANNNNTASVDGTKTIKNEVLDYTIDSKLINYSSNNSADNNTSSVKEFTDYININYKNGKIETIVNENIAYNKERIIKNNEFQGDIVKLNTLINNNAEALEYICIANRNLARYEAYNSLYDTDNIDVILKNIEKLNFTPKINLTYSTNLVNNINKIKELKTKLTDFDISLTTKDKTAKRLLLTDAISRLFADMQDFEILQKQAKESTVVANAEKASIESTIERIKTTYDTLKDVSILNIYKNLKDDYVKIERN